MHRSIGSSPYFLAHRIHPTLPMDLEEATYLVPPPDSVLSTLDLMLHQVRELQKRLEDLKDTRQKVRSKCLNWVVELK